MINYDLIERNKNKIVNFGLIVLALVIALQFYRSTSNQINSLTQQQSSELEKNKVTEEIATLEKKIEIYKNVFVKKDLASVMDIVSAIAKSTSVKIVSVKPYGEEALDNYFKSSFLITLNAPSYHALGNFISQVESNNDIYLVSEINVNAVAATPSAAEGSVSLGVSLKINTISYL